MEGDDAADGMAARRRAVAALDEVADWLSDPDPAGGWGGARLSREAPVFMAYADAAAVADPSPGVDLAADAEAVSVCQRCRLGKGRNRAAYGEGASAPLVLVVGEGPGAEEDAQGRPFVGPAGQLLDRMLLSIGLSRDTNCYIANVVKCRPPGNRDPAGDEKEACLPWLEGQIQALRPRVILALGRVAATTLLGSEEGIGRLRGRWFERGGIPLLASYHPSAILRDESLKRPAWEDLKTLRFRLDDETARD
jgi:DNA polymerase